jgi:transcriptional regulator with XRE-family HTH domain
VHRAAYFRNMTVEHVFTLVLNRIPDGSPAIGGATFEIQDGLATAYCERWADTLGQALATAIADIEACGASPLRIVDEDLVTLADIARRVDVSRETLRRYASGDRGPGGFPPPAAPGRRGAAFYRWTEVSAWLLMHYAMRSDSEAYASGLAYANLLLQARNLRGGDDGDPILRLIAEGLPVAALS